ncbi:MAG TPA: carbamoyltransferase HypF, partial [Caldilinea sp.]|nr:carbamoyltransferase HypF [Caldilinea sp.]
MNASLSSPEDNQDRVANAQRLRVEIHGAVQGVGFRPFVYRLADELALHGWVINDTRGVFIEVEGNTERLEAFLARLPAEAPAVARIVRLTHAWLPLTGFSGFEIRHSDGGGERSVLVLPDLATCPACRAELFDPANRRHRYPFTNCTDCGPRFTIVQALPYDRPNTTMRGFTLCPACQAEYDDPRDHRFHAQPNACAVCGPQVAFYGRGEGQPQFSIVNGQLSTVNEERRGAGGEGRWPALFGEWAFHGTDEVALRAAEDALRRGEIVAAKGLGGFHLLVDARNEEAVQRLRERKARPAKPLAVMVRDLAQASTLCEVPPAAAELLTSTAAPIVLLPRRPDAPLAEGVAPGNPDLGIMLPYTPLHHLLLADLGFPLVATSGNLTDEPICTDEWEALERLGAIAECFLLHDRPIARHADDSVLWIVDGAPQFLRRARGYAPLPAGAPQPLPTILGVGAHLKNTVALSIGEQVFLSQHIGDLESAAAYEAFQHVIADFLLLYEAQPAAIAHDLHPEYLSTKWAVGERVTRWGDDKMTRWQ